MLFLSGHVLHEKKVLNVEYRTSTSKRLLTLSCVFFISFVMCDGFNRGVLRVAVAQICQSMGWDSVHRSTHDLLTDVLQKYLEEIGKSAYGYSQLYCRTEPNLDDLGLAFEDVGIPLRELEDYATQVEQAPFFHQLPRYPKLKANALHHPRNGEIVDRLEYYHEHLPPLITVQLHGNEDADETADTNQTDGVLQEVDHDTKNGIKTVGEETATESVTVKRPLEESPAEPENDAKRRRPDSVFKYSSNKDENSMNILQALQGDVSSPSPTPSPTAVISFEDKFPDVSHTVKLAPDYRAVSSLSLPLTKDEVKKEREPVKTTLTTKALPKKSKSTTSEPKSGSSAKGPEMLKSPVKSTTKSPKTVKEKAKSLPLKSPPDKSPTPPSKQLTATSSVKSSPASPKITPKQKTIVKSPSGGTKKVKKPVSAAKLRPVTTPPASSSEVKKEEQTPTMPKLIIKPVKQEPGTEVKVPRPAPVTSKTSQPADIPNKKKSKTSLGSATVDEKETRTAPPVKLEGPEAGARKQNAPLKFTLSQFMSSGSSSSSNVAVTSGTETIPEHKKKKKKHKDKDKEKKHKKIKKESAEATSAGFSGIPPIPRLKLKLDAGHSTTTSSTSVKREDNPTSGKSSSAYSSSAATSLGLSMSITKKPQHVLSVGDVYKSEAVERTVRTQTLSTTVMSDDTVYICPACHLPDDGSFMIGCDSCDQWFHGACVGILQDPGDDMDWFCTVCRAKSEKSKKKKKKKSKEKSK